MSPSGLLLLDKPEGFTSQDAVAVTRKVFSIRRVGHTGTLDPMATGLLIICLGRATRAVELLMEGKKEYEACFRLGIKTDTGDITGEIIESSGICPRRAEIERTLEGFRGEIKQVPPMYSAIKKDGQPLYKLARRGETVEREAREITIDRLELLDYDQNSREGRLIICCSKGTYIRTLIEDIAASLGAPGVMSALRRTRNGPFEVKNAVTIEALRALPDPEEAARLLLPVDSVFADCPALELEQREAGFVKNGRDFEMDGPDGRRRAYSQAGEFLGLAELRSGWFRMIKSFFETEG